MHNAIEKTPNMNISEAARRSGVNAKTIRYYEQVGLIPAARRGTNGYRTYAEPDVHRLRFIARARSLGFSVEAVGDLLDLWHDTCRTSASVRNIAAQHLRDIDAKIADLQRMRGTLNDLVARCDGNDRPECPIIAELSAGYTQ